MTALPRIALVHGPTPIVKRARARSRCSASISGSSATTSTGGAEAGNKVRKLEWLLGDALARRADTIVTCGGLQSNHARATALVCASLGLACVLFLRVDDPPPDAASARWQRSPRSHGGRGDPADLPRRLRRSAAPSWRARPSTSASAGRRPYVVPEGGSNGLGALGYVECMRETAAQMRRGLAGGEAPFDVVVHACGSGGTAAGVALGAAQFGVAQSVRAMAVCDDAAYFERTIERIVLEARSWDALARRARPRSSSTTRRRGPPTP